MTPSEFIANSNLKKTDAKILLKHVVGLSESDLILHPDTKLSEEQLSLLSKLAKDRLNGTPVEYLVKSKSFYKDDFYVCEDVLIPQSDTETLVEEAVKTALQSDRKDFRILDLCTGSGCIGISVAREISKHFETFELHLSDISQPAVECCKKNADTLLREINWKIFQGDLFENLCNNSYDMILTNPPYIESSVIPGLESDVLHEPLLALDGGESGLEIIKKITEQSPAHLNEGGWLIMEIGYNQGNSVSSLFKSNGFKNVDTVKDLGNRQRVVKGRF